MKQLLIFLLALVSAAPLKLRGQQILTDAQQRTLCRWATKNEANAQAFFDALRADPRVPAYKTNSDVKELSRAHWIQSAFLPGPKVRSHRVSEGVRVSEAIQLTREMLFSLLNPALLPPGFQPDFVALKDVPQAIARDDFQGAPLDHVLATFTLQNFNASVHVTSDRGFTLILNPREDGPRSEHIRDYVNQTIHQLFISPATPLVARLRSLSLDQDTTGTLENGILNGYFPLAEEVAPNKFSPWRNQGAGIISDGRFLVISLTCWTQGGYLIVGPRPGPLDWF